MSEQVIDKKDISPEKLWEKKEVDQIILKDGNTELCDKEGTI
jgi:hypothetical protein